MRLLASLALAALTAVGAHASTLVLSDFSNFTPDYAAGSWDTPTFSSDATTFTIGDFGAAQPFNDGSFGVYFAPADWTGMAYVTLTGIAAGGTDLNATDTLNFFVMDENINTAIASFSLASFGTAPGLTSVTLALDLSGIDATHVTDWGFGTTAAGGDKFAFTFDKVEISSVAIPEPSTYAALLGLGTLGFVAWRRRTARAA